MYKQIAYLFIAISLVLGYLLYNQSSELSNTRETLSSVIVQYENIGDDLIYYVTCEENGNCESAWDNLLRQAYLYAQIQRRLDGDE